MSGNAQTTIAAIIPDAHALIAGTNMKPCVMCKVEFEEKDLDFLGRCDKCFRLSMDTPDSERPKLGVPFVPIYNGKDKYGF